MSSFFLQCPNNRTCLISITLKYYFAYTFGVTFYHTISSSFRKTSLKCICYCFIRISTTLLLGLFSSFSILLTGALFIISHLFSHTIMLALQAISKLTLYWCNQTRLTTKFGWIIPCVLIFVCAFFLTLIFFFFRMPYSIYKVIESFFLFGCI